MANSDYQKIPVTPEVYERVKIISEANGYGERGLGKQIAAWAARELPECNHEKEPVTVEEFDNSNANSLVQVTHSLVTGWYCPICKRVYQKVTA
jgi:hypothetical protein